MTFIWGQQATDAEIAMLIGTPASATNLILDANYALVTGVDATFGNGVTDATAHIQSKIDTVHAAGGGIVYIPVGTYIITATLTMYSGVLVEGVSERVTKIQTATLNIHAFSFLGASASVTIVQAGLKKLRIVGPGQGAGGTGCGIYLKWASTLCTFEELWVESWGSHGISQEDSYSISYRNCLMVSNGGDGFHGVLD